MAAMWSILPKRPEDCVNMRSSSLEPLMYGADIHQVDLTVSGFVSYCLTNSGALNIGHATTWGLLAAMHTIPESEMMPGDIIFFQGTYNADPPTHVGILLKWPDGSFGHPNQITSIADAYWQQHWYCVGRW